LEIIVFGISYSVMLALVTIGFSLTFGISKIANFAYGAVYILGGLLTWGLVCQLRLPYLVSVVISAFLMGLVGFALYWLVLFRLRGMTINEVIATFAVGMAILQFLRWKGFHGYKYALPPLISGSTTIVGVGIEIQRLVMICVGVVLVLAIYFFTRYTRIGLAFRAMSQDEYTAIVLGIDSDKTAALSLGFGSVLATVAAVAILPLGIIDIDRGFDALIFALAVGIIGGLESIPGIIVASVLLGFSQQLVATFLGSAWTMVVFVAAIISVLAVKPAGIFGKSKELEERV
jgi:branched-chain amino acid transport system permease protein